LTSDAVGGVFQYTTSLVQGLSARGARVLVALLGPPATAQQRSLLESLPGVQLAELDCALEWMDEPWRSVDEAGQWLLERASEFRPEVVHLNGYGYAALPFSAPVLVVAHSCVLSWWRAVLGEEAPARYAEYRQRVERGLAAAKLVIAPTHAMLRALRREYSFHGRSCVIANGADPTNYLIGPKQTNFLGAGRLWDRAKNLSLLERIAPTLSWPLELAGATQGAAIDPAVRWLGQRTRAELRADMARTAVYVHPARYEPFGLAPLEAALSGCALVLGDIASLREIWADAALYCDVDDEQAWSALLNSLAARPAAVAELARAAHQRALRYSSEAFVEAYCRVYAALGSASANYLRSGRARLNAEAI
jgi:glycosyltransferase involved in cell wall biosynthesis